MPGTRTADQMIAMVRYHAQELDTATYRDGFSDDTNIPGVAAGSALANTTGAVALSPVAKQRQIPILAFVNRALTIYSNTGAVVSDFTGVSVSLTTGDFTMPQGAGKIHRATITMGGVTKDLQSVVVEDLRRRIRDYANYPPAMPRLLITGEGQFGSVFPKPSATATLTLRAEALEPDLTTRAQYPIYLPARSHDGLEYLAAMMVCASDAENPARAARIQELMVLWQQQGDDLTKLIDARTVVDTVARPGG